MQSTILLHVKMFTMETKDVAFQGSYEHLIYGIVS